MKIRRPDRKQHKNTANKKKEKLKDEDDENSHGEEHNPTEEEMTQEETFDSKKIYPLGVNGKELINQLLSEQRSKHEDAMRYTATRILNVADKGINLDYAPWVSRPAMLQMSKSPHVEQLKKMRFDKIFKRQSRINYEQEIISRQMEEQVLAAITGNHQVIQNTPSIVNNNVPIISMLQGGKV